MNLRGQVAILEAQVGDLSLNIEVIVLFFFVFFWVKQNSLSHQYGKDQSIIITKVYNFLHTMHVSY